MGPHGCDGPVFAGGGGARMREDRWGTDVCSDGRELSFTIPQNLTEASTATEYSHPAGGSLEAEQSRAELGTAESVSPLMLYVSMSRHGEVALVHAHSLSGG